MNSKLIFLLLVLYTSMSFSQTNSKDKLSSDIIDPENIDIEFLETQIFNSLNIARSSLSKSDFKYSHNLASAARLHSETMKSYEYFGHINRKDKDLETPQKRILKSGGDYRAFAENIAYTSLLNTNTTNNSIRIVAIDDSIKYTNEDGKPIKLHSYISLANKVVLDWMNSENHRKNIQNSNLSETGIGAVIFSTGEGVYKQYYVLITQDLGGY